MRVGFEDNKGSASLGEGDVSAALQFVYDSKTHQRCRGAHFLPPPRPVLLLQRYKTH